MTMAVILVPVVIRVPTVFVFIPPSVVGAPAILARLAQFVARMIRLLAVPPVMLDSLVKFVIRSGHAVPALRFICLHAGWSREK
jgi:hypothetical protein